MSDVKVTSLNTCAILRERFRAHVQKCADRAFTRFATESNVHQTNREVSVFLQPFIDRGLLFVEKKTIHLGPLPVDVLPFVPFILSGVSGFEDYLVLVHETLVGRVSFNGLPHQDLFAQGNVRIGYESNFIPAEGVTDPDILYTGGNL